ncbi:MAG: hypothetical protein ABIQ40_06325 [Bacteroidia bacterium]
MKNRILTGWTLRRGFYLAAGIFLLIQSIMDHEWLIALPGIYFASMGIFAFGCASGNCGTRLQKPGTPRQPL